MPASWKWLWCSETVSILSSRCKLWCAWIGALSGRMICLQCSMAPHCTLQWGCLLQTSVRKGALASTHLRFAVPWDCTTTVGTNLDIVRGIQIKGEREKAGERMKGRKCKITWIQKQQWWVLNYTSLWKAEKPFLLVKQHWSSVNDHALLTFSLAGTECDWFCC